MSDNGKPVVGATDDHGRINAPYRACVEQVTNPDGTTREVTGVVFDNPHDPAHETPVRPTLADRLPRRGR